MTDDAVCRRQSRHLDMVWLVLVLATLITYWLGESGLAGRAGMWAVLVMFSLSFIKGCFIALDFMELRHAPLLWRALIVGWLTAVTVFIVGAYGMGRLLPA